MKLAVIIPTYDNLTMLKNLIEDVYSYTDEDFFVCVVEDGQKQETIDWLWQQAKERPNFLAIFHKENKGVAPSWNDALRYAIDNNCTHFAFINDDVRLCPAWWATCRNVFADSSIHLVSTTKPRPATYMLSGWFFILDKVAIDIVGYFDEQFAPFYQEDIDYIRRYNKSGLDYKMIDLPVRHEESTTIEKNIAVNRPDFYEAVTRQNREKMWVKHKTLSWPQPED